MFHRASPIFFVVLAACAPVTQRSYVAVQQIVPPPVWRKVAILPFSGDQKHAGQATEILRAQLQNRVELELVVQPATPSPATGLVSETNLTMGEAQKLAETLDVDAFIQGKILTETNGRRLDAVMTLDLVEAKSGRVVASAHRPSGELLATTEEECIVSASERAAKDMAKAIERLHLRKPAPRSKKK